MDPERLADLSERLEAPGDVVWARATYDEMAALSGGES